MGVLPHVPQFPARKWNGWGDPAAGATLPLDSVAWRYFIERLEIGELSPRPAPDFASLPQGAPNLPERFARQVSEIVGVEHSSVGWPDRFQHSLGKSFRDLARLRVGDYPHVTDLVAYPGAHHEVLALVQLAATEGVQVVPFGGGSSVVGGVEPRRQDPGQVALTVDMCRLNRLIEVDDASRLMRAEGGIYGPDLEDQLGVQGYTLGHFPQSFEYSTLGGWVATRGAGQQSTKYGKIEDMVRGVRVAGPTGEIETHIVPGHAAGPDVASMFVGSEGSFGIITEATMALAPKPMEQEFRAFLFPSWETGKDAIRAMAHRGIAPAAVRLSDPEETAAFLKLGSANKTFLENLLQEAGMGVLGMMGASFEGGCLMLLGFEGEAGSVDDQFGKVRGILRRHQGFPLGASPGKKWLSERYRLPYLRDLLMDRGILIDTLETATTWKNLDNLYGATREALESSLKETGATPLALCHISHVYPDGASLYFTFMGAMAPEPIGQWEHVKTKATDAIIAAGGTVSHHHAVGYEHRPWMDRLHGQGMEAMRALKDRLDPGNHMNPGKLL